MKYEPITRRSNNNRYNFRRRKPEFAQIGKKNVHIVTYNLRSRKSTNSIVYNFRSRRSDNNIVYNLRSRIIKRDHINKQKGENIKREELLQRRESRSDDLKKRETKRKESPKRTREPEKKEPPKRTREPEKKEPPKRTREPEKKEPPKRTREPEKKEPPKRTREPEKKEPPKRTVDNKRKRDESEDLVEDFDESQISDKSNWDEFNVYRPATDYENAPVEDKKEWVSATSVKNYLLRDPLIDWFDLYYLEKGFNDTDISHRETSLQNMNIFVETRNKKKQTFESEKKKLNVFFEMGHKFEDFVIKDLRDRFPGQMKKVVTNTLSSDLNDVTLRYMLEGVPMIEQAAVYNFSNRSFGVADLLVRSDWLSKIFVDEVIPIEEETRKAPLLRGNYHYRVIDIKWTTMYLCSNGKTLRNSHRFPAYKGQLAIYNAAVGQLQGYTPNEAYIMSKAWNLNGNQDHGYNCYKLLGQIQYMDFDNKYIKETSDAIKWVREVRYNGWKWSCNKPTVPELYPNMCNKFDSPYHSVKRELSDQIKEITNVWMVGVKQRKIAHDKGIMTWDDQRCNALNMGIKGKKIGPTINKIIEINRDNIGNIKPDIITNNLSDWQTMGPLDFYLDFEGVTGCLYEQNINLENSELDSQSLFMVGVGYENNGNWEYKTFLANSINRNEERRIVREFIDFIENKCKNNKCRPRFFHWSPAEKSMLNMLNKRYNNEFSKWTNSVTWVDMCKVFTSEPIVLKGSMKFNLKDVAKTMVSHGMIQSNWNFIGPDNGLSAMLEAIEYYRYMAGSNKTEQDNENYRRMMLSIIDYNEIDCKVVWEIVRYLRRNHVKN